jgi:hypothetical protein
MDTIDTEMDVGERRELALSSANAHGYSKRDVYNCNATIGVIVGRAYARSRTGSVETDPVYNEIAAAALSYERAKRPVQPVLLRAIKGLPDLPELGPLALIEISRLLSFFVDARYSSPAGFTPQTWSNLLTDWQVTIRIYLRDPSNPAFRAQLDRALDQLCIHFKDLWS